MIFFLVILKFAKRGSNTFSAVALANTVNEEQVRSLV
jgi:hypothetical protein